MPLAFVIGAIAVQSTVSAYGKIKSGNAAKKAGEFNAQALEQQAVDAEFRGAQEASSVRGQARAVIGGQRVAYAGQGVRVDSGSPLEVQADTAYLAELDANQAIANANRAAWGFRTDAESARMGGESAASAARWGAAGDIAAGASSIAMTSYGWQRSSAGRRSR